MQAGTRYKRLSTMALAVMLLGALFTVPSAVAQGGGDAGRTAGHERFLVLSNNEAKPGGPVLGFGPIHARGTDKVINGHTDRFVFPKGSVKIRHKRGGGSQHFDKVTCYGTFSEHGTWRAVGGTGRYSQVSGGGKYKVKAQLIGCSQNKPPRLFQLQIHAGGDLSY